MSDGKCECDLRYRRWNTNTGQCEACKAQYFARPSVEIELTGEVGAALEKRIDEELAAEREACAAIADAVAITWSLGSSMASQQTAKTCRDIAELIRLRGGK